MAPRRGTRRETELAWRVGADEIRERGYNLDIKNPHVEAEDHADPELLLAQLGAAEAEVERVRSLLKASLEEALLR